MYLAVKGVYPVMFREYPASEESSQKNTFYKENGMFEVSVYGARGTVSADLGKWLFLTSIYTY